MKICWDNLEKIKYNKRTKKLYSLSGTLTYEYIESCEFCEEPFLASKYTTIQKRFCSISCGKKGDNNPNKNPEVTKKSNETKKKNNIKGSKMWNWKGGYVAKNLATYDTLEGIEKRGESRLYCSNNCKFECPVFYQKLWPKGFKIITSREVQPELRQLVFKRDNYTCQKCGKHQDDLDCGLHCHHKEGILWEPLESADIDKSITFCKDCHIEAHKLPDCGYYNMRCDK